MLSKEGGKPVAVRWTGTVSRFHDYHNERFDKSGRTGSLLHKPLKTNNQLILPQAVTAPRDTATTNPFDVTPPNV